MINTFTVNNVYDLKKMLYCDVDGIITDFPLRALNLRKEENF
jgi:glycerophosphoryl diester phosphodiesterase